MRMKRWFLATTIGCVTVLGVAGAACGGAQPAQSTRTSDGQGAATDTRTEFERRLDAACSALGPKLTACAVEDSRADLAAGTITQQQFEEATKPDLQRALTADWNKRCNRPDRMTSRQVRVLEVCFREETACAPLVDCLENLSKAAGN